MWISSWNLTFLFTIQSLNATSVIIRQPVSICIHILVSGEHQCPSVPGVIQAQSMAELMGCHQQQIHT